MHAFPAVDNLASNAMCRKLGFTLLEEYEVEFPPGNLLRCNDWQLDLFAAPAAAAERRGSARFQHSVKPGDAVALRGFRVGRRTEIAGAVGLGKHPEEPFEASRRRQDEEPANPRDNPPMRMWNAAWKEDQSSRAEVELLLAALEDVFSLQDVEQLVLSLVDVERCVEQGRQLFPNREGAAAFGC